MTESERLAMFDIIAMEEREHTPISENEKEDLIAILYEAFEMNAIMKSDFNKISYEIKRAIDKCQNQSLEENKEIEDNDLEP